MAFRPSRFTLPNLGSLFGFGNKEKNPPHEENIGYLHYGRCPRDNSYLHKRGSRVFCKKCGFKTKRYNRMGKEESV